jgi:formate dehydrogenase subunit gamma
MRRLLIACLPLLLAGAAVAQSGTADQDGPAAAARFSAPASAPAAPQPRPDDSNALRAKTQPGNNAPFWRGVRDSGTSHGTVNLPGAEQGVLIQPFVQYPGSRLTTAGEAWRQVRNRWIIPYGGSLVLIVLAALALFYFGKGPIGHARNTGARRIERFTHFERAAHWLNAIAFCVLGVSGIVMAFGKFFLLPVMGHALFGWLTYALKTAHNFAGPLFAVSLLIVFITFLRDNFPRREDITWLLKLGGMLSGKEVPSHRFNAGEKLVFWGGVFFLGIIVVGSGLVMDKLIPGMAYLRDDMQVAHMIHAVAAVAMVAMFLGHIYIGTIGMRGAYRAMRDGYVDDDWAAEHHELWYRDIRSGKIPAQRTPEVRADGVVVPQATPR